MDEATFTEQPLRALTEAFEQAGWKVSRPVRGPQLLCLSGSRRLAVEVRVLRGRLPLASLRASLADAVLVARMRAQSLGASALPIVATDALSDRAIAALQSYMSEVAPDNAWGAIDSRGRWHLVGDDITGIAPPPSAVPQALERSRASGARSASPPRNPFSDLGQWMLKVLLAPHVPRLRLHDAQQSAPVRGVVDLARRAAVAPSRASMLVTELERRGYVERWRRELRLVRVPELLNDWRAAANAMVHDVPVRFALPTADPSKRLDSALADLARHEAEPRACLGLFAAAARRGVSFVRGAPLHVLAESAAPTTLTPLGLVHVDHPAEADLFVRVPRFRESAFRGASAVQGVRAADLVQVWLDVAAHPSRGAELAAEIAQLLGFEDIE